MGELRGSTRSTLSSASSWRAPAPPPPPAHTLQVLLVDESAHSREPLAELLRDEGFDIQAVPSATLALRWITRSTPDVIVADVGSVRLPEGSLLDAASVAAPAARIVLLTPYLDPSTCTHLTERGVTTFPLPLDLPAFMRLLEEWEIE